jgi:RNA 2',3'-cyclic 3'-phosphodiesterase
MRLFVAVTLGEELISRAVPVLKRLEGLAPRARWVAPEKLHVTLSFLGEVESEQVPALAGALRQVGAAHAPLVLRVEGGGSFGSPTQLRVLWAGLGGDVAALAALQAEVVAALRPLGFMPEERNFTAHLTLARAQQLRGDRALAACVRALEQERWGEVRVDRLLLFESVGSRYVPRAEALLSRASSR